MKYRFHPDALSEFDLARVCHAGCRPGLALWNRNQRSRTVLPLRAIEPSSLRPPRGGRVFRQGAS